jgi:hypothetical protein
VAVDTETPIEIESVKDEERFFGGDIVWWALLLLISIPILFWGLAEIPGTGGFLLLSLGGILAGLAFAQVMLRLPYFTNGFARSVLIALVIGLVITGVALLYNMTLDVPTAPQDVMFKPPISGG